MPFPTDKKESAFLEENLFVWTGVQPLSKLGELGG
jgi:hypothetical protein